MTVMEKSTSDKRGEGESFASYSTCACGFKGFYLSLVGLSRLKTTLGRRRIEKHAKKTGWQILKQHLTHCPQCNEKSEIDEQLSQQIKAEVYGEKD